MSAKLRALESLGRVTVYLSGSKLAKISNEVSLVYSKNDPLTDGELTLVKVVQPDDAFTFSLVLKEMGKLALGINCSRPLDYWDTKLSLERIKGTTFKVVNGDTKNLSKVPPCYMKFVNDKLELVESNMKWQFEDIPSEISKFF